MSVATFDPLMTGVMPLTARLHPWQQELLERPPELEELLDRYGSPLNLIAPAPSRSAASTRARDLFALRAK